MADGRRVYRRERFCFRWSPFDCAQGELYEFHFASLFEIHSTAFLYSEDFLGKLRIGNIKTGLLNSISIILVADYILGI